MPLVDMELPAGSLALVSPRTLHRHADYWHEPDRFDPHRWQNGTPAGAEGVFLPFGSGARLCPGARFAGIEMNAILHVLLSRAAFSDVSQKRAKPLWNLTARPDRPIRLRVAPRKASQPVANDA
jgi:cytochrome P450